MKPKPIQPKRKSEESKDIHKGWEIIGSGNYFQAFHVETGRELWDTGFPSRDAVVASINEVSE